MIDPKTQTKGFFAMENENGKIVSKELITQAESREQLTASMVKQRQASLLRILPTKFNKAITNVEMDLIVTELEYQKKIYTCVKEAYYQGIREAFNHYLTVSKIPIREKLIIYFNKKLEELDILLKPHISRLVERALEELKKAEQISDESIRKMWEEIARSQLESKMKAIDATMQEFLNILPERLKSENDN